jgi:hypothetical protein
MKILWMPVIALTAAAGCAAQSTISTLALKKTDGTLAQFRPSDSPATAVVFISALCPMSVEYSDRLSKLAIEFETKGVRFLLVNSNVNESDADVDKQRSAAGIPIPVYRDPGAQVAGMLGASATPTAVVLDRTAATRYFGMIDNSRNPARITKQPLRAALQSVLAGAPVEMPRTRVLGCTIKNAGAP